MPHQGGRHKRINQAQDGGVPDADDILLALSPHMDNVHTEYDDGGGGDGNNDDGGATFDSMNNIGYLGEITQVSSSQMLHFQTPTSNSFSFFKEGISSNAPMRHENISWYEQFQNISFQHPIQRVSSKSRR